MIIKNCMVFYDKQFKKLDVEFQGDTITRVGDGLQGEEMTDLEGKLLLPGFIDVHTHGREGLDFSTASPEEIGHLRRSYAENGVTSILATTMSMPAEATKRIMSSNRIAIEANNSGSRILGINMEGPYLGVDRKGCHDVNNLEAPDFEEFEELDALSGENIRMVDLDPKLPNAIEFIKRYGRDKTISLAHTSATYELACEAVKAGATHVTHLFNAMNSLHHREPGIVGMVSDYPVYAELICDGIHIHPAVIRMMFRLMSDRLVLISDSMSAAGLGDGEYELGGLKVFVQNRKAALADGTIAGSTLNVFEAVKNVISFGVEKEQAILSATLIPAKSIREEKVGEIKPGRKADILIVSPDFTLEQVYVGGNRCR